MLVPWLVVTSSKGCSLDTCWNPGNPKHPYSSPPANKTWTEDRKPRQMLALWFSLQQRSPNTILLIANFSVPIYWVFFQILIISSFQQLSRGWVLASDLLHGTERVTNYLYLEFLTVVGHYIYVKVTISSLFHLAFHPGLWLSIQAKHSLQSMILLWKN